jgi:hypothetical protein
MPGDPILDLNAEQIRSLATAVHSRLCVVQGVRAGLGLAAHLNNRLQPPGTGKTVTIVRLLDLLKSHFRVPDTILVCTPTHVSVEHILQKTLKDTKLKPVILTPEHRTAFINARHTLDAKLTQHPKYFDYADILAELDDADVDAQRVRILRQKSRTLRGKMAQDILNRCDVAFSTIAGMSVDDGFTGVRAHFSAEAHANETCSQYADFRIVILDESAQCSEATSLIPLVKGCAHLTLVGDHKQLAAIVSVR